MSDPNALSKLEVLLASGEFGEYLIHPKSKQERMLIVGNGLEASRKRAGLSQKDVCVLIDCKPQTYSGYEKGKYEPPLELLVRLSHLYNVSLDYLLGKYDGIPSMEMEAGTVTFENEQQIDTPEMITQKLIALESQLAQIKANFKT